MAAYAPYTPRSAMCTLPVALERARQMPAGSDSSAHPTASEMGTAPTCGYTFRFHGYGRSAPLSLFAALTVNPSDRVMSMECRGMLIAASGAPTSSAMTRFRHWTRRADTTEVQCIRNIRRHSSSSSSSHTHSGRSQAGPTGQQQTAHPAAAAALPPAGAAAAPRERERSQQDARADQQMMVMLSASLGWGM